MSHYPPGVSGSEGHFYDPPEVMAFEAVEWLDDIDGYETKIEDMFDGGQAVGLHAKGNSSPILILSVKRDVDHGYVLSALEKAIDHKTVIDGKVAVFCNHHYHDGGEAVSALHSAIEGAVERIRNHDPREDHPDV